MNLFPSDAEIKESILAPLMLEEGEYDGVIVAIELVELRNHTSIPRVRMAIEGRDRFLFVSGSPDALKLIWAARDFLALKSVRVNVRKQRITDDRVINSFTIKEVLE